MLRFSFVKEKDQLLIIFVEEVFFTGKQRGANLEMNLSAALQTE